MNVDKNVASTSAVDCNFDDGDEDAWNKICRELEEPLNGLNNSCLRKDKSYYGFDNTCGNTWIFPINYPIRSYQFNIAQAALFRNTLVVLPTGLGKTFIAAVVMYNIYRWYPTGKIIFMAPTRPLVNQQIEACRKVVGIPKAHTAEMTGQKSKVIRRELWDRKKVFFATPQVVQIDIFDPEQDFPFDQIKLLVIDEAHRAKGKYAYTEVVNTLIERNPNFRILALSATPGRRIDDVVEIIRNLRISHVEVRSETSIDVVAYTHKKNLKTVVVELGERLKSIRDEFVAIIDPYIRYLIENGVVNSNISNMSSGMLILEQKRFRENSINERHPNHSVVATNFSSCISLYHALDLLERHGIRVFLNYFEEDKDSSRSEKYFVATNLTLRRFLDKLRKEAGPNPFAFSDQTMTNGVVAEIPADLDFGHPKFDVLKENLLEFFQENENSKAIIFCEYRESVKLLHRLLLQNRPLIRPRVFVGQGGTGSIKAVTQKQQLQIMADFRSGKSNALIATCVAEEGIDVGDVDLIVCFDISNRNPTRFMQRIGRTGRKRQGKVLMLVTEGKEHALLKDVLSTRDKTNQKIAKSREVLSNFYTRSPRMIPPEFNPKCLETFIKIDDEEATTPKKQKPQSSKENKKSPKLAGRRKKKNDIMEKNSVDIRKLFKKLETNEKDDEIFFSPPCTNVPKTSNCKGPLAFLEKLNNSEKTKSVVSVDTTMCNEDDASDIIALFEKVNGFWESSSKEQNISANTSDIILSNDLPEAVKKCVVKQNYEYVKEKFDALEALSVVVCDDDIQVVESNEERLRKECKIIENLLGDKSEVKNFLKKKPKSIERPSIGIPKKICNLFAGLKKRSFDASTRNFMNKYFENVNIDELVSAGTKNDPHGASLMEISSSIENSDMSLNDPLRNFSVLDAESKYKHQLFKPTEVKQSTPLRAIPQFSTPTKNIKADYPLTGGACPLETKHVNQSTPSKFSAINLLDSSFPCFGESPIMKDSFRGREIEKKALNSTSAESKEIQKKESSVAKDKNDTSLLFDDDFDDFLANNTVILDNIDPVVDKNKAENLNINPSMPTQSMVAVEDILQLAEQRQQQKKTNDSVTIQKSNRADISDIENFDLNEFLDPIDFDDEDEIDVIKSSQSFFCPRQRSNSQTRNRQFPVSKENDFKENIKENKVQTIPVDSYSFVVPSPHPRDCFTSPNQSTFKKATPETSPSVFNRMRQSGLLRSQNMNSTNTKCSKSLNKTAFEHINLEMDKDVIKSIDVTSSKVDFSQRNWNNQTANETTIIGLGRNRPRRKRAIESSDSDDNMTVINKPLRQRRKKAKCAFVQSQAAASDVDSPDEDEGDSSQFVVDSIIVLDEDIQDDPSVNMRAKYLESVRSPLKVGARFKIPAQLKPMNYSDIFSQPVPREETNIYKDESFVVTDDEAAENDVFSQMCPLERAEAILEARRKVRKKKAYREEDVSTDSEHGTTKRRRIVINDGDSSDER